LNAVNTALELNPIILHSEGFGFVTRHTNLASMTKLWHAGKSDLSMTSLVGTWTEEGCNRRLERMHNKKLHNLYALIIIRMIKLEGLRWAWEKEECKQGCGRKTKRKETTRKT
jgi:hypothetical protein